MSKPNLTCSTMVEESPQAIAEASKKLTNEFWSHIWQKLPQLANAHNKLTLEPHFLAEKLIWGTSSFLTEAGDPLNAKNFQPKVVRLFRTVGDCILEGKVNEYILFYSIHPAQL